MNKSSKAYGQIFTKQRLLWSNIYQTAVARNDKYKPYFKSLKLHWTSQIAMARNELEQQNFVNIDSLISDGQNNESSHT